MFYSFVAKGAPYLGADVLGGKGLSLHTMRSIGMPVPPGFVIGTEACKKYQEDPTDLMNELMGELMGFAEPGGMVSYLGDIRTVIGYMPLLSVRSGAPVSMPGMMDTILNVGLTTHNLPEWADRLGKRAALDCYRRLIQMMGATAYGVPADAFEDILTKAKFRAKVIDDKLLTEEQLEDVIIGFAATFKLHTGVNFPDTLQAQLQAAIGAVFGSWMNPRALTYRKLNNISDEIGTAVVIQAMVFGNANDNSGSGVLFSRCPTTGAKKLVGEFLPNAQGEDVVAGVRTPLDFAEMATLWPALYAQLNTICMTLELHYKDMMDLEFTVQDGKLYMLQCRPGKRAAMAGVEIAFDLLMEDVIDRQTLRKRLAKLDLAAVTTPKVDPAYAEVPRYTGIGATSGVVSGIAVLTAEEAEKATVPVILVRLETDPDDIGGMAAAIGILTRTGGATSHAAVVARGMNKACVVGCTGLPEDLSPLAGHKITLDALTGRVWVDEDVPVIGGETNDTLRRIATMVAHEKDAKFILPYDASNNQPGHWYLDGAALARMTDAEKAEFENVVLHQYGNRLTLDFRPASCNDDEEVERLWGEPVDLTAIANTYLDYLCNLGLANMNRVTVIGSSALMKQAKALSFSSPEIPTNLGELLESGALQIDSALEKKLGGKNVTSKLKEVLSKAGFVEKPLVAVAPWQYVLREWLAAVEG